MESHKNGKYRIFQVTFRLFGNYIAIWQNIWENPILVETIFTTKMPCYFLLLLVQYFLKIINYWAKIFFNQPQFATSAYLVIYGSSDWDLRWSPSIVFYEG